MLNCLTVAGGKHFETSLMISFFCCYYFHGGSLFENKKICRLYPKVILSNCGSIWPSSSGTDDFEISPVHFCFLLLSLLGKRSRGTNTKLLEVLHMMRERHAHIKINIVRPFCYVKASCVDLSATHIV